MKQKDLKKLYSLLIDAVATSEFILPIVVFDMKKGKHIQVADVWLNTEKTIEIIINPVTAKPRKTTKKKIAQ